MKLIGRKRGGFIAELSELEVAFLLGHAYVPAHGCAEVGDELNVSEMIGRVNQALDIKRRLTDHARTLRACADLVEMPLATVAREDKQVGAEGPKGER